MDDLESGEIDYLLDYLAEHLFAQRRASDMQEQVVTQDWMLRKRRRFGTDERFSRDLTMAVEAAAHQHPVDVLGVIRASAVYATLRSRTLNIPISLFDLLGACGAGTRGRDLASLVSDQGERVKAYWNVGAAMMRTGTDRARVLDVAEHALIAAQGLEDDPSTLSVVASLFAGGGQITRAVEVVSGISDEKYRALALRAVASALAEAGSAEAAADAAERCLDTAPAMKAGWSWTEVLSGVAEALITRGQQERAIAITLHAVATARGVNDRTWRAEALGSAARLLHLSGESKLAAELAAEALAVTDEMNVGSARATALSAVARALVSLGDQGGATELAEKAFLAARRADPDDTHRAEAFAAAASAMQQSGEVLRAIEVANECARAARSHPGPTFLMDIAAARFENEEEMGAARTVLRDSVRVAQLSVAVRALSGVGQHEPALEVADEAITIARTISHVHNRPDALALVGRALVDIGEIDRAVRVSEQALAAAETLGDEPARAPMLAAVAEALADCSQVDAALGVAARIGEAEIRSKTLSAIVKAMARAGLTDRAVAVVLQAADYAESLPETKAKVMALSRVAEAFANVGQPEAGERCAERALSIAQSMSRGDPLSQIDSLREAGLAFVAVGRLDVALTVGRDVPNWWSTVLVLSTAASALAGQEKIESASQLGDEACEAARQIERDYVRVRALAQVAIRLAHLSHGDWASKVADEALRDADTMQREDMGRIKALWAATAALAAVGRRAEATRTAQQALAIVGQIADDDSRSAEALSLVAKALILAGRVNQAIEVTEKAITKLRRSAQSIGLNALSELAETVAAIPPSEPTLHILLALLAVSRETSREALLTVLQKTAPMIAREGGGIQLIGVGEAVHEIEGWWSGQPQGLS